MTRKKVGFPCNVLNAGSSFISQDEGMPESPEETVENDIGPRLIPKEASHLLDTREACRVQ